MKTTDWKYDFSSLPHWKNREKMPFVFDEFFELTKTDVLCCIYSIAEVSMDNYIGFLAILKNKDCPSLLLNITDEFLFSTNFSASTDERFIFLQPSIYDERCEEKRPILIIDLIKCRFSYLLTKNLNRCYKIKQECDHVFTIEADALQRKNNKALKALHGKEICIDKLQWHDIQELKSLPKIII